MSIIGNPIMAGVGGVTASIFVTGLSETDTVTATNGSKSKTGVWTQKPNPAFYGLPDGYTQLEYIESTGTQYIQTGISAPNGFRISCEIMNKLGAYSTICAARPTNTNVDNNGLYWEGSSKIGVAAGGWATGGSHVTNKKYQVDASTIVGNLFFKLDDVSQSFSFDPGYPQTNQRSGNLLTLFATINMEGEVKGFAQNTLYAAKIFTSVDDSELVGDFIPCKRNSDGAIGLYDLVSNTFFANAGTGEFVAGSEVPQTIDGFLIKPIREFGTWTVTATDGTDTYTQDVLVDVITEYEIEITKKLYLYRDGDECEDVTGGWVLAYGSAGSASATLTKNADNMYISYTGGAGAGKSGGCGTVNKIDLTSFSKVCVKISNVGGTSSYVIFLAVTDTIYADGTSYSSIGIDSTPSDGIMTLDISGVNKTAHIRLFAQAYKWATIHKVWLE